MLYVYSWIQLSIICWYKPQYKLFRPFWEMKNYDLLRPLNRNLYCASPSMTRDIYFIFCISCMLSPWFNMLRIFMKKSQWNIKLRYICIYHIAVTEYWIFASLLWPLVPFWNTFVYTFQLFPFRCRRQWRKQ